MKTIYIYILLFLFSFILRSVSIGQQLPLYSQYYFNDYAVNPAIGGTKPYVDARSNHRYQWQGIDDAPRTYTLSAHGPLKNNYAGIGAFLFTDHVGPTRRTGVQFSYTYKLRINQKIKLGIALSGGMLEWKLDAQKITLYDPNDQVIVNGVMRSLTPDAKFGLHLYHPKWFLGFSVPNLLHSKLKFDNALNTGLSRLENHFIVTGGYKFRVAKDITIEPSTVVKYISPAPVQADIMARVIWKEKLWLGGVYRTMDAASVLLGITYRRNLSFGYSYDFTTTNLRNYSAGTHELFIGIRFSNLKESAEGDISDEFIDYKKNSKKTKLKHIDNK